MRFDGIVMPAHSRSKNGVGEPVIGPATSGRTRWLACVAGIHVLNSRQDKDVDGRNKSGHDERVILFENIMLPLAFP
jgi:hypothetical protein